MKKGVIIFISVIGFLFVLLGISFSFINMGMKRDVYLVEFNSNGGTFIEEQYVETGNYVLKPPIPKKEGFTFLFWKYNDKEYDFNTKVTQDMTLSAVWELIDKNQKKYTLSFDTAGGNILDSIEVLGNGTVVTLPIPKREGYVFKNWRGGDQFYYNSILVDKDITLVAVWESVSDYDNQTSLPSDNIIGSGNSSDDTLDDDIDVGKPVVKHVRTVDDLLIEVDSTTVKFSKYLIDFSDNYDKSYYYSSVDGYEILKSSSINGKYELIAKTTTSPFELKDVDTAKECYYAVRAYKNINGKTYYSDDMKIVYVPKQLVAPTNVFYRANLNQISVTFDINDPNIQKYQIIKKKGSSSTIVASSDSSEISWNDNNYACYIVRGYSEVGNSVRLYGLKSKEVCFKPILESVKNINTTPADSATGFDYKTTWDVLVDRPLSYMLDVYRKDSNGNQLDYIEEYIFDNTYLSCGFDNGNYVEVHVHGYDKTSSYELKGPASIFYIR